MSFALIFVGLLLSVAGVRNTQGDLFALVHDDFTGKGNFIFWTAIVLIVGGIGYIPAFRPLSKGFLALIVLALILTKGNPQLPNGGLFLQLENALKATESVPASSQTKGTV